MKRVIHFVACVAAVSVTVTAGILWELYKGKQKTPQGEELVLKQDESLQFNVSLEGFASGDSTAYDVELLGEGEQSYTLAFEKNGNVELAQFVDVRVAYGEVVLAEGKLSEYLQGRTAEFSLFLVESEPQYIAIIYSMDIEVGNEAQNTVADFRTILTSERI